LGNIVDSFGKMDMSDKMDLLPPDLKQKIQQANTALQTFGTVV
jgi:hypothetical protein